MKENKNYSVFILYFVGWYICNTNGILGLRGMWYAIVLFGMLTWSTVYFVKTITGQKLNTSLKAFSILYICFTIHGIISLLLGGGGNKAIWGFLQMLSTSYLPIFGFYYLFKRHLIDEKWMMPIVVALLLSGIGDYYVTEKEIYSSLGHGKDLTGIINNSSYRIIQMFPLLFLIRSNDWFRYAVIIVASVFVVMAAKRGPILISFVFLLIFLADTMHFNKQRKCNFMKIASLAVAFYLGYMIVYQVVENNLFLQMRFEQTLEGDSSGRDEIYYHAFNHIINEQELHILCFGNGISSTLKILGISAHNDWLEIALNQGLIGIMIYLYYYYGLFVEWRRAGYSRELHMSLGMMILIILLTSFFSNSFNNLRIAASFTFGYCFAMLDRESCSKIFFKKNENIICR